MSGILRSMRFAGTAKYARNIILTDYQLMSHTAYNRIEDTMRVKGPTTIYYKGRKMTQGKNEFTNIKMKIRDATGNLLSKVFKKDDDEDKVLSSKLGSFIVSNECSKITLITKKKEKSFIFPVAFNTTFNGILIEPLSNKIATEDKRTISFQVDNLSVAIDGHKLKLNVKNHAETFILSHALYINADSKPNESQVYNGIKQLPQIIIKDITTFPALLQLRDGKGGKIDRVFDPQEEFPSSPNLYSFGIEGIEEDDLKTYDDSAKIKLEYPINIFVQGFSQVVKIHETGESFTIYHTVELQALKENADKTVKAEKSKIGKFDILLLCGDLLLERRNPEDDKLLIKQELWIRLDLNDEEPGVYICPFLKRENFKKD